ncbi:MAG: hypothetical protein LBT93_08210 [Treponema sp.]|jgi:hypothetical protein|nr:hypothetical protein [Treponema sp.]
MQRENFFFLILIFLVLVFPLTAQEGEDPGETPIDSDWSDFMPALYARGDQTFTISLGPIIPAIFRGESGLIENNLKLGGTGSLAYNFFLTPSFFIGAELGIMFSSTLGKNHLFIIPFGFKIGYQWVANRFEFPLTLMVGGAPQRYQNYSYFGLIIKPGASAFFRYNSDWSFGLNTTWWWIPEWTSEKGKDVFGNFIDVTLAARYHF